jgi:DNA-binding transcriptional LysR family regulator
MEMHQIQYFLAVSEYLNFRCAAEKCHVSAPALTRAIQKLEAEIGGKLFRSENEDWIQSMVAAGFGVTFLPEFSVVTPGVLSRPLIKPEVIREISLVSIEGRTWSPAVETFTRAVQTYPWHAARLQKGA